MFLLVVVKLGWRAKARKDQIMFYGRTIVLSRSVQFLVRSFFVVGYGIYNSRTKLLLNCKRNSRLAVFKLQFILFLDSFGTFCANLSQNWTIIIWFLK